jgi:hypothetical protein
VTSEGHAYARFRRALDSRNATAALSAASELEHVGLVEALELTLLLSSDPRRQRRAALRWFVLYVEQTRPALEEAQAVLGLVAALSGERRAQAAHALAAFLDRRGQERAAEVLVRWASR